MEIRKFTCKDALSVSVLIEKCFNTVNLGGHTEEGKQLQIEWNSPENLIKRAQAVRYFVACEADRIIGICGYDMDKVQTLFVDVEYQNRGIGNTLLNKVLLEAVNERLTSLKTWATFYSEVFYSKSGFEKTGEIHLPEGRSDIILIEMLCDLSKLL
ncbi:GNAT family N-acetyltransferase [Thermodesulfobacteriota bacterium]